MKISLITATYNSINTLETSMQTVLEQNYPELEYVIIDGDSGVDTVTLLKNMEARYDNMKWLSEPDQGIYDALNKGLTLVSGDVIGFVHSDDFLADSTIVSKIMERFQGENVDGVYGDLLYVDKVRTDKIIRYWKSRPFDPKLLNKGWMPPHPTLFLKKGVYQKHGKFDLSYKIAADYDFMLRVLKDNTLQFSYLPEVIVKMRVGGVSNRSLKNLVQKSAEDYKAMKSNGLSFPPGALLMKNLSKIPQFMSK